MRIKDWKNFISESIELKSKQWIDVDLSEVDDMMGDYIWKLYSDVYLKQEMDLSAKDWNELKSKYNSTWLIDVNNDKIPDAFIIYKKTEFGSKLALMAANEIREAKRESVRKVLELLSSRGWYCEASKRLEEIFSSSNLNFLKDKVKIKMIIPNAFDIDRLGYYRRPLSKVSDKIITKRIYGNPIFKNE